MKYFFGNLEKGTYIIIQKRKKDSYGVLDIYINNFHLIKNENGNLSFLLSNLETFLYNKKNFIDEYFWKITDDKIIRNFSMFKGKVDLDSSLLIFNEKLFKSKLPFNSEFLDDFIFLGLYKDFFWHFKVFEYENPKVIYNYKIEMIYFEQLINDVVTFLDKELVVL